ncbi:MAG: HlyD family efflux transporter periplasmic adaptor subunit [Caldilineaceae bacterium]
MTNSRRFWLKWTALLVALVFVVACGGNRLLARQDGTDDAATVTAQAAAPKRVASVTADGYVQPVRSVALASTVPGRVAQVHVAEDDWVEAGAALVTLDSAAQQAAVAQARANLLAAEADLSLLRKGARPEEIAQAQAAVTQAQMNLERLLDGATAEQIATAQQAVAVAQANLSRAQAGATDQEVIAAEAVLRAAEAEKQNAQAAYDRVSSSSDIAMRPESLRLEQATIEYERARAAYDDVAGGPRSEDVQIYAAQVQQAQASLAELTAGAHPADVTAAQAQVQSAQAALDLRMAGARPEEITAAIARVEAARAALGQAEATLAERTVTAPFAGTVSSLSVETGDYVTPGVALVQLGDTRAWIVETDTLNELDVVHLAEGDRVEIVLDALPDQPIQGIVRHIRPAAELKRGDVTYTVQIDLDDSTLPIRWGMTAAVSKY